MRILHTSDWHIGKLLYGRSRDEEFQKFFDWLINEIKERKIDAVVVAGDIFDVPSPTNKAQKLYYTFLKNLIKTDCRHLIVVGGNHDSPTFLDAPKELLEVLNVRVVSAVTDEPADEVIVLEDANGDAEMIVCAVPFLRDRHVRTSEAGETAGDKEQKTVAGIAAHYRAVVDVALRKREEIGKEIPIIATGHLYAAGSSVDLVQEGDGVRQLYVGTLGKVGAKAFPEELDYVALGHLHIAQKVGGVETIRYSGSPLPMGFGEAKQTKSYCIVEFDGKKPSIELVEIPRFQKLVQILGDWETIEAKVKELRRTGENYWVEVRHTGEELLSDFNNRIESLFSHSKLDLLSRQNERFNDQYRQIDYGEIDTEEISKEKMFDLLLEAKDTPEESRERLRAVYLQLLQEMEDEARDAE